MAELTPMMQQYLTIKEENPGTILLFRLGDFYEMFDADAIVASSILDITLTTRDRGKDESERTPMCGVPYHSVEAYIARLIAKGLKVAICEQTEDPALAKGIVKREVVRIITPGTVLESSLMDEGRNNYLACLMLDGETAALAYTDVSSGEFYATSIADPVTDNLVHSVCSELGRFLPREVLLCGDSIHNKHLRSFIQDKLCCTVTELPDPVQNGEARVTGYFDCTLKDKGLEEKPLLVSSLAALIAYLGTLKLFSTELGVPSVLTVYDQHRFMELDLTARRNMELTESLQSGERKGTLLWVLDYTGSSIGARLLRSWIEKPLTSAGDIVRRQHAVGELFDQGIVRSELTSALNKLPDIERLVARIVYGTGSAREMRALSGACGRVPSIIEILKPMKTAMLCEWRNLCDPMEDIFTRLEAAICDEPPFSIREGGFIREGYNEEVDRLRALMTDSKGVIAAMEQSEKEKTGIKSLKIGYNKVFGYYIEVSKSYIPQVPDSYIRKQTLANCERYITGELKELEGSVLSASDKLVALEGELFQELRLWITENAHRIKRTAVALAHVDVLSSLAEAAVKNRYICPVVDHSDVLQIEDGRHPVVEKMLSDGLFVANDTHLSYQDRSAIITGPNMAGKSTYMRQVALITLMAQIGSFIPAKAARIGVVDRIFTRIGASDDLAGGRSTFMVEMTEVADILHHATKQSLIILDEVGRGTSTFDGMSVARAVLEYISSKIGAKTLFATHYHELTDLEEQLSGVKNYNIAVKKRGDEIVFLRRIVSGGADDSFGVEVAKMAGLPDAVISRAKTILRELEEQGHVSDRPSKRKPVADTPQISLESLAAEELRQSLLKIDVNTLTPIEALNLLHSLRKKAESSV